MAESRRTNREEPHPKEHIAFLHFCEVLEQAEFVCGRKESEAWSPLGDGATNDWEGS